GQLASAHVDLPHGGLSTVWPEFRPTSPRQCRAACSQRSTVVRAAAKGHRRSVAQFSRGRTLRRAPAERGNGSLGGGKKSLLCTLFSLLTIAAYGWYARRPDLKEYLVVVVAFALALMSKPMAVSLPLVLLLLDYWPLERYEDLPFRRKWVRLSLEKLPLLLLSAASSVVTTVAQRSRGAVAWESILPLSWRLQNAIVSYVAYIGKTGWPAKLAVFYHHPLHSLSWSDVIAAAIILVAITMAVLHFHRARYLAMGWFLFVITLIPVIGIIQVGRQAMADRYAYIPCIGLFIILAWGLSDVVTAAAIPRVVPAVAALCLILAFAAATTRYLPYWQSGVKLLAHARMVAWRPD